MSKKGDKGNGGKEKKQGDDISMLKKANKDLASKIEHLSKLVAANIANNNPQASQATLSGGLDPVLPPERAARKTRASTVTAETVDPPPKKRKAVPSATQTRSDIGDPEVSVNQEKGDEGDVAKDGEPKTTQTVDIGVRSAFSAGPGGERQTAPDPPTVDLTEATHDSVLEMLRSSMNSDIGNNSGEVMNSFATGF